MNLQEYFGNIDIYLFDQLLKGTISPAASILDAGCGNGRNITYFLRNNYDVYAVDSNSQMIDQVRMLAVGISIEAPPDKFIVASVDSMPFKDDKFDLVISSAVLHFARNNEQFDKMLDEMWRVLKPKGVLFTRLASSIGIERLIRPSGEGRYFLPDGTERFLVDYKILAESTERLWAVKLEPIKTTNVENLRCMTTWVIQKII